MPRKRPVYSTIAFEVGCPSCGEPQDSPDGSHIWMVEQIVARDGAVDITCSCGTSMRVEVPRRVNVR